MCVRFRVCGCILKAELDEFMSCVLRSVCVNRVCVGSASVHMTIIGALLCARYPPIHHFQTSVHVFRLVAHSLVPLLQTHAADCGSDRPSLCVFMCARRRVFVIVEIYIFLMSLVHLR